MKAKNKPTTETSISSGEGEVNGTPEGGDKVPRPLVN